MLDSDPPIFYALPVDDCIRRLDSSPAGLSASEADKRLEKIGANVLETSIGINPFVIFINQFKNFIIYILLFAVLFSIFIGEYVDSLIILAILLMNAIIGFAQELSAGRSLEALKKMSALKSTVVRDGTKKLIDAKFLVPGDIITLEAGDKVPADARLIEAVHLKVEESSMTGESVPTEKNPAEVSQQSQIGEQRNMLFSSTSVVTGHARALVVATGMASEIGKITTLIKEVVEEMTPLQKRLDLFGKKLGVVIIAICVGVFIITLSKDYFSHDLTPDAFITFAFIAISLAVAAVPTALPAVVTIALSIGVKRLLHKKTLVRRLSSVETLGSCDVICTDKTGTLTQNQMTVRHAWTPDAEATLEGIGYQPQGSVSATIPPLLFKIGLISNNSSLRQEEGEWLITGDPTEAAFLTSAAKAGVTADFSRLDEIPFDSDRKRMSVLVTEAGRHLMYSKGAPLELLKCCSRVLVNGQEMPLTDELRALVNSKNDIYASQAMRVLGFAYKDVVSQGQFSESELVFVGLQAMIDPPRADVIESIARTKEAGIRVIMITGDYPETARAIGLEIGIEGNLMSGAEIENLSEEELIEALKNNTNIFARVVPEHKQRIVGALQKAGHTVAMTGDGVNDAPALKKADIGVAVGSGTEVAKEASDFVLLDDSFTHIVNAIEEGRGIYDNIQKSIMLLLSGNLGEVLIIFLAAISGMNLPLTAILLLWINMVTDGAPALAYSVDPYGHGIMTRKPKPGDEGILPLPKLAIIGALGSVGTVIALTLFAIFGGNSSDPVQISRAQTMVFNFVVLYECILVFVIRKSYRVPLFTNAWVWAAVIMCALLQAVLMYTPLKDIFKIVALTIPEVGILFIAGIIFYFSSLVYQQIQKKWLGSI